MSEVKLYLGDCLEVLPTLLEKSVDAILTDLPYGTTACSWDTVIPFEPMWKEVKRVLKPRGVFVTTASQPFVTDIIDSNRDMFRYDWIWIKNMPTGAFNAKKRPMKAHESVLVFSDTESCFNPQFTKRTTKELKRFMREPIETTITDSVYGDFTRRVLGRNAILKYPDTRLVFDVVNGRNGDKVKHPTQKPVALYEYLTLTYTNPGDTVMDICAGSGTTGVACVKTGRNFIGIEKREDYLEIMEKRIEEAQMQLVMPI